MKKQGIMLLGTAFFLFLCGCRVFNKEETAQELDYEIVAEEEIPEEMKAVIEEKKAQGFQITFEEKDTLYIGQGYGEKDQEGYEILVDQCQYSDDFVYFHTILNGPREETKEKGQSYPYLVVRCEVSGKEVIFLNH